jgi:hypothetical protein
MADLADFGVRLDDSIGELRQLFFAAEISGHEADPRTDERDLTAAKRFEAPAP